MESILDISDYAYGYPDAGKFLFRDIRMAVLPGECHCITGPTGIGKSTLLMAIQGLLPPGKEEGNIRICQNSTRPASGLVLQNPDTQILTASVGAEVAFGLENLRVPPDDMKASVLKALTETGLALPLDRDSKKLSMGQKYRLILAALIVMKPCLLMIDEPSGQLDPQGLEKLKQVLKRLKAAKMGLVISDHRPKMLEDVVDVFWRFDAEGKLNRVAARPPATIASDLRRKKPRKEEKPVIHTRQLAVRNGSGLLWSDVCLDIFPGEMVAFCGKNGSGKTTFMQCLMGTKKPEAGQIRVLGEKPVVKNLRGRVGCLFQDPCRQLFEDTVFEEVGFQLRRAGDARWKEKVRQALSQCGISDLTSFSPHKLSYGQQHLVAMAMSIAGAPELLLLDDPFTGLDPEVSKKIFQVLGRLREQNNTTVIVTSHHPEDGLLYDRRLMIREGGFFEE